MDIWKAPDKSVPSQKIQRKPVAPATVQILQEMAINLVVTSEVGVYPKAYIIISEVLRRVREDLQPNVTLKLHSPFKFMEGDNKHVDYALLIIVMVSGVIRYRSA